MSIKIDRLELPMSIQEARAYLQHQTDTFGVFFDMDRCLEISAILMLANKHIRNKLRRLAIEPSLAIDDKEDVVKALGKMGISRSFFMDRDGKLEFTAQRRKDALPSAGPEATEFLNTYTEYTSNKRNIGFLNGLIALPECKARSKDGHRMTLGRPTWNILSTSRLSAEKPGVQGVPRSMPDIICEPQGFTLHRCDSSQIEPRINFSYFTPDKLIQNLIKYYGDAYFGIMHYCIMDNDLRVACREDFSKFAPIEITDEIKDMRQNVKTLTNAGSYGSSNLGHINAKLANAYDEQIVKHPIRIQNERKIREAVRAGVKTFYGAFGTPVTPGDTEKYTQGSSAWDEHLVRCGINNPVQTTASELMLCSIAEARKVLSTARNTHIAFYKHDEAVFYISDEDMSNGTYEKLETITGYEVMDWIPIPSEPILGVKKGSFPSYL